MKVELLGAQSTAIDMSNVKLSPDGSAEAVSLAQLLQQLELTLPHVAIAAMVAIVRKFLHAASERARGSSPLNLWPTLITPASSKPDAPSKKPAKVISERKTRADWLPPLSYACLLGAIGAAIGREPLVAAVDVLYRRGPTVAFSFGTMALSPSAITSAVAMYGTTITSTCPLPSQLCRVCGQWRVLRSICLPCGTSHRFGNGGSIPVAGLGSQYLHRCVKRVKAVIAAPKESKDDPDVSIITSSHAAVPAKLPPAVGVPVDIYCSRERGEDDSQHARAVYSHSVTQLRKRVCARGLEYFQACGRDSSLLDTNGGDMLFLAQKLWLVVRNRPEWCAEQSKRVMIKYARRWMRAHRHISVTSVKHLQDCVEGLHGLKQAMDMLRGHSQRPLLLQKLARLQANAKAGAMLTGGPRLSASTPVAPAPGPAAKPTEADNVSTGTLSDSDDDVQIVSAPVKTPAKPLTPVVAKAVSEPKARPPSSPLKEKPMSPKRRRVTSSGAASSHAKLPRNDTDPLSDGEGEYDDVEAAMAVDGFDFARVKNDLATAMASGMGAGDIFGFDPVAGRLPFSPIDYCSHCGKEGNRANTGVCVNCDCRLGIKVDYGCMTDALVWSFVFEDVGLPLMFVRGTDAEQVTMDDVIQLLPGARAYKGIDELGHNFFKLQAYFMTHFIYVVSEWGKHQLPQELFWEEIYFIMTSMKHVIILDDPELVGEFLHCLRILGIAESDPSYAEVFQEAIAYLLHAEYKNSKTGERGLWVPRTASSYTRYHAAYTGVVGCLDFGASEPRRTPKLFL